jgi:hypothetical protein
MVDTANTIFRDFVTDGVPASGANKPRKSKIREWGTWLESLANLAFTSGRVYSSKAALLADLTPGANLSALVVGDATAGNDGLYMKNGGTGTGSWTQLLDFVPGAQFVNATDAGSGTANAIEATTDIALAATGRQIVALSIFENNTGAATVRFNGGGPSYPIKTNSGVNVAAGYLVAGSEVLGRISGAAFKLFTDVSSAADRAAAEAAAAAAEAAQAAAEAAAASLDLKDYATVAEAQAAIPNIAPSFIRTAGNETVGDGGGGLYTVVASDPGEPGSFALPNISRWAKLVADGAHIKLFGAHPSVSDNTAAINDAMDYAEHAAVGMHIPAGVYVCDGQVLFKARAVTGDGQFLSRLVSTLSGGGAAFLVQPQSAVSDDNTFRVWRDFGLAPSVANGCDRGLEFALANAGEFLSNWLMERLYIGAFSNNSDLTHCGFRINNSIGNTNGFFRGTVQDCWIQNGIRIVNGGDSLSFLRNTIHGNGIGIYASLVTGARQFAIRNNNITHLSECIYLSGINGDTVIEQNWMETPSYLGSYTGASGAVLYLEICQGTSVKGNTVQPLASVGGGFTPAAYAINSAGNSDDGVIDENSIYLGGTGHILISAGSDRTVIGARNKFDATAVITDNSTTTRYDSLKGSYTGSLTGCTTSPTGSISYTRQRDLVELSLPAISGTSNTTAATITGMPAQIRPATTRIVPVRIQDNGTVSFGLASIDSAGTITLSVGASAGAFTNTGTKGVAATTLSYQIS